APGDLVARYRRGEHLAVWSELRRHEAIAGALRDEALAVARETMQRVAGCADRLAVRLAERGWAGPTGALRTEPTAADRDVIAEIARRVGGPLPPSLLAFWQEVGGVDWVWNYENEAPVPDLGVALPMDEMDPLAIDAPPVVTHVFESWDEQTEGVDPE